MVTCPIFFGILCRKSSTTVGAIAEQRAWAANYAASNGNDADPHIFDEDAFLASWSCAMNPMDAKDEKERLLHLGWTLDQDFIITSQFLGQPVAWAKQEGRHFHHVTA